ncbi:hypothetical protein FAZ15_13300 [Sphingobacterium olei]|uniref:histidine kinase n=1 Tax=Sphingobacterium olei TaxID=2571155 RepID=A0A4U0NYD4_9SPHI|nr:histidine kinase [Sphingobacterium olei]TJZ59867.1 hypothetical protein FAZ15_13300 [Sphingobacterium olei]
MIIKINTSAPRLQLYLWLVLCMLPLSIEASPYRYTQVLTGVDKSHSMIRVAVKDPSGLIWLLSGGQLYRYDGVNVMPFAKLYAQALPYDEVQSMAADPWGRLWLNTRNGLLIFDINSWSFVEHASFVKGIKNLGIVGMFSRGDAFFVATETGMVWQVHENHKTFLFYFDPQGGRGRRTVGSLFVADHDQVWLAFNGKLYSMNLRTYKRRLKAIPADVFDYVEDLLPIKGGLLIRNYRYGYYIFDGQQFKLSDLRGSGTDDFTNWSHWSFTEKDRIKIFYKNGRYFEYSRDTAFVRLAEERHRLEEDVLYKKLNGWQRAGDEWLLATDEGLYSVFRAKINFDFVESGSSRGMIRQHDKYYFGGYGYLDLMTLQGDRRTYTEAPENNYYTFLERNADTSCIALEGDFLGFLSDGRVTKAPLEVPAIWNKEFSPMAFCMLMQGTDTLLVGTSNGIWRYAITSGTVSPVLDSKIGFFSKGMRIMSMGRKDEALSFTTENGYYLWQAGQLQKIYPADDSKLNIYTHLHQGENTYLATKGRGLIVLDKQNKALSVDQKSGLASNTVYQLAWIDGALFIGTHEGLSVRTQRGQVYSYHDSDGLPFEEFNHHAIYYDKKADRLFMGGTGGYIAFDPSALLTLVNQFYVPAPVLVGIHIGKRSNRYWHSYAAQELKDTIYMPADAVWFSMDFAHLDQYRQAYHMEYRIVPLMEGYQPMPASRQINLSGLSTGQYHVSVRALADNDGGSNELNWLLYKKPHFTETLGFYVLILALIAGLTSFILYERSSRAKGEKRLRKQISRDLHDEVGGLLTGISMQADLLRMGRAGQQEKPGETIGSYSREAIQMMDDIIWAIDARNNEQGSLGDRMKYLAGQMIEPLGMPITFDMDHRYERKMLQTVRQSLYLIYKEALHNICKHAAPGEIYIKLHVLPGSIDMVVKNTGHAPAKIEDNARMRVGQGQRNMQMRAEQIGATFVSEFTAEGYVVEVSVPVRSGLLTSILNPLNRR